MTHPIRARAIGGRFKWHDQGETPNTMFGLAEYPNGQYVYFNVRNVNYEGYERQVENEYYFEDGGRLFAESILPREAKLGRRSISNPERSLPVGIGEASSLRAAREILRWPMEMLRMPTTDAFWDIS